MAGANQAASALPERLRRARSEFEDYLRTERGVAKATAEAYRRDLTRYLRSLAAQGVEDVAKVGVRQVQKALQEVSDTGASPATINRHLATIRHFHRFCLRERMADSNPATLVDGAARGLALPRALGEEDVARIIEAAADTRPQGLRDRAILELLYGCGLRVSELTRLDVDDVDLEERTVRCRGKGGRERIVPMGRLAADALDRYLSGGRRTLLAKVKTRATPAVFVSMRGSRLSRQSVWQIVKRYAEKAHPGADVFPHAMRHSFATHLLAHGADLRAVQEALGHARLSTTQVYTLLTKQKLKDVYESAHPRGRSGGRSRDGAGPVDTGN